MIVVNLDWFGSDNYTYNTYIGGVGGTITTKTLLAAKLSITDSNISNFTIDTNNNIRCLIDSDYTFVVSAFSANHDLTYYLDYDGHATGSSTGPFYDTVNMVLGYFPGWVGGTSTNTMFRCASSGAKSTFYAMSLPSLNPIGTDATDQQNFTNVNVINLFTDVTNQTNNGGSPDGDLSAPAFTLTNLYYVTLDANFPDDITDLTATTVYGSFIDISWSAPSSTNTIVEYVVFVNGVIHGTTTSTTYTVDGLDELTAYNIEVLTYDNKGNFSGFSNTVSETTLAYQIPTGNIVSYWNFDSDSLDQVGANDGTDTSMSYVSTGGIGNSADFTASTSSQISITDDDSLSFGNGTTDSAFSISLAIKFNVSATSIQYLVGKLTSGASSYAEYIIRKDGSNLVGLVYDFSATANLRLNFSTSFPNGVWMHIVMTYDGSGSISGLKLYKDGISGGTDASTGSYTAMENGTANLYLGKNPSATTQSFSGYMDELVLFDVGLSSSQVTDLYTNYTKGNAIQ